MRGKVAHSASPIRSAFGLPGTSVSSTRTPSTVAAARAVPSWQAFATTMTSNSPGRLPSSSRRRLPAMTASSLWAGITMLTAGSVTPVRITTRRTGDAMSGSGEATARTTTADERRSAEPGQASRGEAPTRRVTGLDGIRGLAALFVVVHHTYLESFPGYPVNTGPSWLAWLLYGHLAVVVFIALSGFSLAVAPARRDWQLGGKARFAHRRAWRILPPYWAALVFSLIIAWAVVPQPGSAEPNGKAVAVYGLLLQDVFGSSVPNGAFWSI